MEEVGGEVEEGGGDGGRVGEEVEVGGLKFEDGPTLLAGLCGGEGVTGGELEVTARDNVPIGGNWEGFGEKGKGAGMKFGEELLAQWGVRHERLKVGVLPLGVASTVLQEDFEVFCLGGDFGFEHV